MREQFSQSTKHYTMKLMYKVFMKWKERSRERGNRIRRLTKCFSGWKKYTTKSHILRENKNYLELKSNILNKKSSLFTWRKRLKAQKMIRTVGIYHILLSNNISLALLSQFGWKDDSDHFRLIYCFRRWLDYYKYRNQWRMLRYLYIKRVCFEHTKTIFYNWYELICKKKNKIYSRNNGEVPRLLFNLNGKEMFKEAIKNCFEMKRSNFFRLENKTDLILLNWKLQNDREDVSNPHLWIDKNHNTSLHIAVQTCDLLRVKSLIEEMNHIVNCININRQTPLHVACYNSSISVDYIPIIKYLLECGSLINLKDINGKTPLELCGGNSNSNSKEINEVFFEHLKRINSFDFTDYEVNKYHEYIERIGKDFSFRYLWRTMSLEFLYKRKEQEELEKNHFEITEIQYPYDNNEIHWWYDQYVKAKEELKELKSLDAHGLKTLIVTNNKIIDGRRHIISNMMKRDIEIITEYNNYEFLRRNSEIFKKSMDALNTANTNINTPANIRKSMMKISNQLGEKANQPIMYKPNYEGIINGSNLTEKNKVSFLEEIKKLKTETVEDCEKIIDQYDDDIKELKQQIKDTETKVVECDKGLLDITNKINDIEKRIYELDTRGNSIAIELQTIHNKFTIQKTSIRKVIKTKANEKKEIEENLEKCENNLKEYKERLARSIELYEKEVAENGKTSERAKGLKSVQEKAQLMISKMKQNIKEYEIQQAGLILEINAQQKILNQIPIDLKDSAGDLLIELDNIKNEKIELLEKNEENDNEHYEIDGKKMNLDKDIDEMHSMIEVKSTIIVEIKQMKILLAHYQKTKELSRRLKESLRTSSMVSNGSEMTVDTTTTAGGGGNLRKSSLIGASILPDNVRKKESMIGGRLDGIGTRSSVFSSTSSGGNNNIQSQDSYISTDSKNNDGGGGNLSSLNNDSQIMYQIESTNIYNKDGTLKSDDKNKAENINLVDTYRFVSADEREAELKALYQESLNEIFIDERKERIGDIDIDVDIKPIKGEEDMKKIEKELNDAKVIDFDKKLYISEIHDNSKDPVIEFGNIGKNMNPNDIPSIGNDRNLWTKEAQKELKLYIPPSPVLAKEKEEEKAEEALTGKIRPGSSSLRSPDRRKSRLIQATAAANRKHTPSPTKQKENEFTFDEENNNYNDEYLKESPIHDPNLVEWKCEEKKNYVVPISDIRQEDMKNPQHSALRILEARRKNDKLENGKNKLKAGTKKLMGVRRMSQIGEEKRKSKLSSKPNSPPLIIKEEDSEHDNFYSNKYNDEGPLSRLRKNRKVVDTGPSEEEVRLIKSQKLVKSIDSLQRNKNIFVVLMNRLKYKDQLEDSKKVLRPDSEKFASYETFSNLYEVKYSVENGLHMWSAITDSYKPNLVEDDFNNFHENLKNEYDINLEQQIADYEKALKQFKLKQKNEFSDSLRSLNSADITKEIESEINSPPFLDDSPNNMQKLEINGNNLVPCKDEDDQTVGKNKIKNKMYKQTELNEMMKKRNKKFNTLKPLHYLDNREIIWAPFPKKNRKRFVYSQVIAKQGFLEDSTFYPIDETTTTLTPSVTASNSVCDSKVSDNNNNNSNRISITSNMKSVSVSPPQTPLSLTRQNDTHFESNTNTTREGSISPLSSVAESTATTERKSKSILPNINKKNKGSFEYPLETVTLRCENSIKKYKKYLPKSQSVPTVLSQVAINVRNYELQDLEVTNTIKYEKKEERKEIIEEKYDPLKELREKVQRNKELLETGKHPILLNKSVADLAYEKEMKDIKSNTTNNNTNCSTFLTDLNSTYFDDSNYNNTNNEKTKRKSKNNKIDDKILIELGNSVQYDRRLTSTPYHTVRPKSNTLVHRLPHIQSDSTFTSDTFSYQYEEEKEEIVEEEPKKIRKPKISKKKQLEKMLEIMVEDKLENGVNYKSTEFKNKARLIPANRDVETVIKYVDDSFKNIEMKEKKKGIIEMKVKAKAPPTTSYLPSRKRNILSSLINEIVIDDSNVNKEEVISPISNREEEEQQEAEVVVDKRHKNKNIFVNIKYDGDNEISTNEEENENKKEEEYDDDFDIKYDKDFILENYIYRKREKNRNNAKKNEIKVRELELIGRSDLSSSESECNRLVFKKENIINDQDDEEEKMLNDRMKNELFDYKIKNENGLLNKKEYDSKGLKNDREMMIVGGVNGDNINDRMEMNMKYCNDNRDLLEEYDIKLPEMRREIKELKESVPNIRSLINYTNNLKPRRKVSLSSFSFKENEKDEKERRLEMIIEDKKLYGDRLSSDEDENLLDFLGEEGEEIHKLYLSHKKKQTLENKYDSEYY